MSRYKQSEDPKVFHYHCPTCLSRKTNLDYQFRPFELKEDDERPELVCAICGTELHLGLAQDCSKCGD